MKIQGIKILTGFIFLIITGCVTNRASQEPFYTRLFEGTYDSVWLSTLRALNDYPLKISNKDTGRIQTEIVSGPYNEMLFNYPDAIELPERYRYTLKINFAKLASDDEKPLVRVRIVKELEKYQDFYAGWVNASSDGLEEKILLYRVDHVLKMERSLASE